MAGVEILGALASSAQLADISLKLLKTFSGLYRDLTRLPEEAIDNKARIEQLVDIADLVVKTPALHSPLITATIQNATVDAQKLLEILKRVDGSQPTTILKQQWRNVSYLTQETTVRQSFQKLESSKATLSLCINTLNSDALQRIGLEVTHVHKDFNNAAEQIPVIRDTVRKTLMVIDDLPKIESHVRSLMKTQQDLAEKVTDIHGFLPAANVKLTELTALRESIGNLATSLARSVLPKPANPSDRATESKRRIIVPVAQNPLFTGRQKTIDEIGDSFAASPDYQQRIVLIGLGGVGKTQIATAFVYSSFANAQFSKIFWTFANTRAQIIKSFTELAKALGLSSSATVSRTTLNLEDFTESNVPIPREVDALLAWLSQEGNSDWLMVFDNLDDLESFDICEFFPKVPFGHIIITSRRQSAARLGKAIPVDVMSNRDALELLYKCSRISNEHNQVAAKRLVDTLGNLPLALDQAGAYIAAQSLDFDSYLDLFDHSQAELLSEKPPAAVWSYKNTVYTTWEISVARIAVLNPLAVEILNVAATFDSNDIPLDLVFSSAQPIEMKDECFLRSFFDFASPTGDYDAILGPLPRRLIATKAEIILAIGTLVSFSLVIRKQSSKNLAMHPLVHSWLNDRVLASGKKVENTHNTIGLVNRAMFNACNLSQFAHVQTLYSHVFKCNLLVESQHELLSAIDVLRLGGCIIAIDAWVPLSVDQATLVKSDRFYQLVSRLSNKSTWNIPEAMWQIRNAYRLSSQGYRKESSAICEAYFRTSSPTNRYEEMYQACMAQMYGPSLFRRLLYSRAEEIFARSDTSCDSLDYMLARKNLVLGAIKIDLGQLKESEALLQSCKEVLRRRVGPDFFIWSVWHQLMALCRLAQDLPEDAEEIVWPMLKRRLQILETGQGMFSFSDYELVEVYARSLRRQSRFDEAINFVEDILRKTASQHPPPARALGELSFNITMLELLCANTPRWRDRIEKSIAFMDYTSVLREANAAYERAADAYALEWTRGTWVFKFFPAMVEKMTSQFQMSISNHYYTYDTQEPTPSASDCVQSTHGNVQTVKTLESIQKEGQQEARKCGCESDICTPHLEDKQTPVMPQPGKQDQDIQKPVAPIQASKGVAVDQTEDVKAILNTDSCQVHLNNNHNQAGSLPSKNVRQRFSLSKAVRRLFLRKSDRTAIITV